MTALRAGPEAIIKIWGSGMTSPLRERLLANDSAALIACLQGQRQSTKGFSGVLGRITVPTLIYTAGADPIHDAARQTASEIPGAQFVSLPGLTHIQALWRSDLVLPQPNRFWRKQLGANQGLATIFNILSPAGCPSHPNAHPV
jgi:pimeloyl-ACP methyl ester carboxylesterase